MSKTFIVSCPKCNGEAKLMFTQAGDTAALKCDKCKYVEPCPIPLSSVWENFPKAVEVRDL